MARRDWLNVVYLPTGVYLFYFPDPSRRSQFVYIPEARAYEPQKWPEWPTLDDAPSHGRPLHVAKQESPPPVHHQAACGARAA